MTWLIIVILAHFCFALVFIIDKYILTRSLPHPIVYAFYVGVLSIFAWVLAPFGLSSPSLREIILILLAGIVEIAGGILFYRALNMGEVSRIVPFVGSFVAIFILILSSLFINEQLTIQQLLAFILLVLGGLIVFYKKKALLQKAFGTALIASLFYAIFWVITKHIFSNTSFISGLIWIRTGAVIAALTLLFPKRNRDLIFKKTERLKPKIIQFFATGRVLTVLASIFMYLAVFLGSVTLANSLQGFQYAFVLILAFLLFKKFPSLREEFSREIIFQKILAVILIGLGLVMLVI